MIIPVFIISFNRGRFVLETIRGLRMLNAELDIIIHDNGSDDPEPLEILDTLGGDGVLVVKRNKIFSTHELNNTNFTISDYFVDKKPAPYIVTDGDICMDTADPSALQVYLEMLNMFPESACVGPMLKIHDIPEDYPLRNRVLNRHIEQFWQKKPSWCRTLAGWTAYQFAAIDTTLALHRAGEPFRRLKQGIRVYEPFEARHLDWYLMSPEKERYHHTSSPGISHWNNTSEYHVYRNSPLENSEYIIVERGPEGSLVERNVYLNRKQ